MADLTPEKLDELERLHEAATPGEWRAYGQWLAVVTAPPVGDPEAPHTRIGELGEFDADLVTAMRNSLPALIAAARRLLALESTASASKCVDCPLPLHEGPCLSAEQPATAESASKSGDRADGWIPCSERLPEFGSVVQFYGPHAGTCVGYRHDSTNWSDLLDVDMFGDGEAWSAEQVTHWRLLSAPPAAPEGT